MSEKPGVLEQERQRQAVWADRGLPDPVRVRSEERTTERLTGETFRSPKRDALDSYFEKNPERRPQWW